MATLNDAEQKVLATALEKRRRDDSLEQAVGREVRRAGLAYQVYLEIMETVRDHARKHKTDPWESVKVVLKEQQEQQGP